MTEERMTETFHLLLCIAFECAVGSSGYLRKDSHRRLIQANHECVGGRTCNNHIVTFQYDKSTTFDDKKDLTEDQKRDHQNVIGKFEVNKISSNAGKIVKTDNFRIDMQGKFKDKNREYFQRQNHTQHRRDFCNILIIIHSKMIECSLDYKNMNKYMIGNS